MARLEIIGIPTLEKLKRAVWDGKSRHPVRVTFRIGGWPWTLTGVLVSLSPINEGDDESWNFDLRRLPPGCSTFVDPAALKAQPLYSGTISTVTGRGSIS